MKHREIPSINELLENTIFEPMIQEHGRTLVRDSLRTVLENIRQSISTTTKTDLSPECLAQNTLSTIQKALKSHIKPVFNATGTVLHTNLGRAPMAKEALRAAVEAAVGYCNLELDLATGKRGHRSDHLASTLRILTGCEASLVVNNNAGAVLLALAVIARDKEVIVSRGELIEIGGGFRIPEVMESSGAILKEVGTTNRTHLRDFKSALNERTGLILKASASNYAIVGFTAKVPLQELVILGKNHQIPVMYDLGSGNFYPGESYGWSSPLVKDLLELGIDVLTFSGDKLLGGPQAGIILGRKDLIAKMASHPLARALRIDKMTLAALDATLKLYLQPEIVQDRIPGIQALCQAESQIAARAKLLLKKIKNRIPEHWDISLLKDISPVGGGALPQTQLQTWVVSIQSKICSATTLSARLRFSEPPIISRIQKDMVVLDLRTVPQHDIEEFAESLVTALNLN